MQAAMVEPVDVLWGGVFDVIETALGASVADQFSLVQAVAGFGQGIDRNTGQTGAEAPSEHIFTMLLCLGV